MNKINEYKLKLKQFWINQNICIIDKIKALQSKKIDNKVFWCPSGYVRGWIQDEEKMRKAISLMPLDDQKRKRFKMIMMCKSIRNHNRVHTGPL